MKNYRIHLNSHDRLASSAGVNDCDFIVRMSGEQLKKGQLFVESLVVDSEVSDPVDFANVNYIEVKSRSFQDMCSWNSNTRNKDVISQITSQFEINNLTDFRYSQRVNKNDIGFPVQDVKFSDLLLNMQIISDEGDLSGTYHWHSTLLFKEDEEDIPDLVKYDRTFSGHLPERSIL